MTRGGTTDAGRRLRFTRRELRLGEAKKKCTHAEILDLATQTHAVGTKTVAFLPLKTLPLSFLIVDRNRRCLFIPFFPPFPSPPFPRFLSTFPHFKERHWIDPLACSLPPSDSPHIFPSMGSGSVFREVLLLLLLLVLMLGLVLVATAIRRRNERDRLYARSRDLTEG